MPGDEHSDATPTNRPKLTDRTTFVYRAFGTRGQLLYVGISQDQRSRLRTHAKSSIWWRQVWHAEIAEYGRRADAFAAESWAIRHEEPLWNFEQQARHCPAVLPEPVAAFGYRVRHWSWNGDTEYPAEEVREIALVQD